jgi:hypothetical protein
LQTLRPKKATEFASFGDPADMALQRVPSIYLGKLNFKFW